MLSNKHGFGFGMKFAIILMAYFKFGTKGGFCIVVVVIEFFYVKDEVINMTRAWDKEKF